ncbi:MAG: ATP-binding protein, partial [Firmicutes bacterium]|nr:ATP-binding protein [Bacillota bacterium]
MIRLLEKNVAGKIAAGEVIERPIYVVKELVENSIDAGSSDIVVEIKKGGTEYIRVTDDGMGIAEEEAELAFMRHATSKIEKAEDLDALTSLGFRGEALASIAAVSRTELITKTREQKTGIKLSIEGSQVTDKEKIGCPDGTSIIVGDLFFNTPARRKFLKSQAAEAASIIEFVTRMALAYPDIKFRMINNDAILFATRGNGSRLDAIMTVSGRKESSKLLEVYGESQG